MITVIPATSAREIPAFASERVFYFGNSPGIYELVFHVQLVMPYDIMRNLLLAVVSRLLVILYHIKQSNTFDLYFNNETGQYIRVCMLLNRSRLNLTELFSLLCQLPTPS